MARAVGIKQGRCRFLYPSLSKDQIAAASSGEILYRIEGIFLGVDTDGYDPV
jgi:hypothetical protein